MQETKINKTYYDILDVRQNATPELIRTAYIMAKNTYSRDSLATYTLFHSDELGNILEKLEEAFTILSDPEKRKLYDSAHGIFKVNEISAATETKISFSEKPAILPENGFRSKLQECPQIYIEPAPTVPLLDPALEEKLQNPVFVDGIFLQMARETRGRTVEEVMEFTKLNRNYVLALEQDQFHKLPASVFVRGFVIQYAKALRLNAEKIASLYMAYFKTNKTN